MPGRPDFAPVSGLFPLLLVREVRGDVGLWCYIQTKTSRPAVVDTWPLRPFLLCMVVYCDTFVSAFQVPGAFNWCFAAQLNVAVNNAHASC